MEAESYERLKAYTRRATEADIETIRQRLAGMNRGPIKKLWNDVMALWRLISSADASWVSRGVAIGALLYLVSPIDAVPDFLPVLGLSDDAGVILSAVAMLAYELTRNRRPAQ